VTDLATLLRGVEEGRLPPADGSRTVLPQPSPREAAVVAFTAHIVVAADIDPAWVDMTLPPDDLSGVFTPPFLGALADKTGRRVNAIDMVALAPPGEGAAGVALTAVESDHPRVRRARRYRDDVRVWTAEGGVVVLGRGLAGRWEVGIEVERGYRNRGLGRALAAAARGLVPDGRPLWAQIAPANAASVRAFVAAGYAPVGMEALLVTHSGPDERHARVGRSR
jgi:GNAT superfamily N-acetyltransferase